MQANSYAEKLKKHIQLMQEDVKGQEHEHWKKVGHIHYVEAKCEQLQVRMACLGVCVLQSLALLASFSAVPALFNVLTVGRLFCSLLLSTHTA